eukprot:6975050-Pyramimonas_sp.AAC.1
MQLTGLVVLLLLMMMLLMMMTMSERATVALPEGVPNINNSCWRLAVLGSRRKLRCVQRAPVAQRRNAESVSCGERGCRRTHLIGSCRSVL